MRRLPVYFLIDVSESMVGDPIANVETGMRQIAKELMSDPYALESAYFSVIVFAGKAKTLVPLMELTMFYPPALPIGAGTSLGNALRHLMAEIDANIQPNTPESKGDWRPLVFLFTDGAPTDNFREALSKWKAKYQNRVSLVAISMGGGADLSVLGELTENVLVFEKNTEEGYKKFFEWITSSIKSTSQSMALGDGKVVLDKNSEVVERAPKTQAAEAGLDDRYVVLLGKCQNRKTPYLVKYSRSVRKTQIYGMETTVRNYLLEGAFRVSPDYFELADGSASSGLSISTEELEGATPPCPCCGNPYIIAHCSCGGMLCLKGPGVAECPWCGSRNEYGFGSGDWDVQRTRG